MQKRISQRPATRVSLLLAPLAILPLLPLAGVGQNPAPAELTTRETQPTFKLQVERNLVMVRAVVRDSKGNVVRDLRKEDFRLFDNGKFQTITHFAVEGLVTRPMAQKNAAAEPQPDAESAPEKAQNLRYTALYFDDVHASFEDLVHTRDAAERFLASALQPGDRVGIFTASGQNMVDFTDDRRKLHEALFRLRPRPLMPEQQNPCPEVLEYQAYQIVHERDPFAIDIATAETLLCRYNSDQRSLGQARAEAEGEAVRVLNSSETEAEAGLRGLNDVVRRMALLPGQRSIVMISPGFLTSTLKTSINDIIDRAIRSNVIINTYDAKGLYAPVPLGDASKRPLIVPSRADLSSQKSLIQLNSLQKNMEVLSDTALDTGGAFFHNSNDFDEGFRRVGSLPEVYYVLGFSPQNLKYDGRFHSIKLNLATPAQFTLQARRGYFAPREAPNEAARAKEELEQAVFSQDQRSELPVEMHTQFFKTGSQEAKLSVMTRLDVHLLPFRKKEGRNLDDLTIVTVLFDRDGKYLTGNEKKLELRLLDVSLHRLSNSGITMKTSFDVKPGSYLVRQVVRDAEGGQLSGLSRTIEIPF